MCLECPLMAGFKQRVIKNAQAEGSLSSSSNVSLGDKYWHRPLIVYVEASKAYKGDITEDGSTRDQATEQTFWSTWI